jgi:molecular chaperone DnaK
VPSPSNRPGFGIDFGTTNSVVAVATKDRKPQALTNDAGDPHPSVVWFSPEEDVVVGAKAKKNINAEAEKQGNRFISSIKVLLGEDRLIDVGGELRPAYVVASEIFRHLRKDAIDKHGWKVEEAVVSVPVHFDGLKRADIRRAAELAGIKVLRFVHEPFAALVGYYRTLGDNLEALPTQTVLVFDWGGGTLDITLVRSEDGLLEEIATGGLPRTAGDRFDQYVQSFAETEFIRRNALPVDAYLPSRATRDRIAWETERAKIELSSRDSTTIGLPNVLERDGQVLDLKEVLRRDQFEQWISADVDAAMHEVQRMLEETRIAPSEVHKVLLVGGTSAIPLLRRRMAEVFGVRAQPVSNGQTVIAEGAAVIAQAGYEPILAAAIQIALSDKSAHTILSQGMRVPTEDDKALTLFCTDNRDGEARLVVRQGIGSRDGRSFKVQDILSVPVEPNIPPPGQYERVYAKFSIDQDLILRVEGRGAARDETRSLQIHDLKFGLRLR